MGQKISSQKLKQLIDDDLAHLSIRYQYNLSKTPQIPLFHPSSSFACCRISAESFFPFFGPGDFEKKNYLDDVSTQEKSKSISEKFVVVKVIPKVSPSNTGSTSLNQSLKISIFFTLSKLYQIPEHVINSLVTHSTLDSAQQSHEHHTASDKEIVFDHAHVSSSSSATSTTGTPSSPKVSIPARRKHSLPADIIEERNSTKASSDKSEQHGAKPLFSILSPGTSPTAKSHLETSQDILSDLRKRGNESKYKRDRGSSWNINGVFPPKHSNIPLLYGVYESDQAFYVILDYFHLTLEDMLLFNKHIMLNNDIKRRFLFYQILQVIFFCHKSGFAHGKIKPCNILVNDMQWVYITALDILYTPNPSSKHSVFDQVAWAEDLQAIRSVGKKPSVNDIEQASYDGANKFSEGEKVIIPRSSGGYTYGQVVSSIPHVPTAISTSSHYYRVVISSENDEQRVMKDLPANAIGKVPSFTPTRSYLVQSLLLKWQHGELSNFDYLMALNALAGRRIGDFKYHPVLPWVIDFKSPTSWRDLTKSKFRLNKGDQMLDLTFQSKNPHHVTEPLSEITYFSYLARRTSIQDLKTYVRNRYEPKEYPSSVERMYEWTPEECIPEFFTDPTIFKSIHDDMEDLQLPSWCSGPSDFIAKHKDALESDYVSRNLHHWIDIVFGYKLTGNAGIQAKNLMIRKDVNDFIPSRGGYYQLFFEPHPQRIGKLESQNPLLSLSSLEQSIRFGAAHFHTPVYHIISTVVSKHSNVIKELPPNELFADDLFALGCTLAELYIFQPLFNSKTLELYLQGNFTPSLDKIPQPAQMIVAMLIDLNPAKRKKALQSQYSKKLFPPFFKYVYWFLSWFYTLPKYEERYAFVVQHEDKLADLPLQGFLLIFSHILHMFFSVKQLWINAVKILQRKLFRQKILELYHSELLESSNSSTPRASNEDEISLIIKSRLLDLYARQDNEELQMEIYSYPFVQLLFKIMGAQTLFLEKLLPFYLEALRSKNLNIAKQVCDALCQLSASDLGIILTVQHVMEPLLLELSRRYTLSLARCVKTVPREFLVESPSSGVSPAVTAAVKDLLDFKYTSSGDMTWFYTYSLLSSIANTMGVTNATVFFIPKLMQTVRDSIQRTERLLQHKKTSSTSTEPQNSNIVRIDQLTFEGVEHQILEDYFVMVDLLLERLTNKQSTIGTVLYNNLGLFSEIIEKRRFIPFHLYSRIAKLLRQLLFMCDHENRTTACAVLSGCFKNVFAISQFTLEQEKLLVLTGIDSSTSATNNTTPKRSSLADRISKSSKSFSSMFVNKIQHVLTGLESHVSSESLEDNSAQTSPVSNEQQSTVTEPISPEVDEQLLAEFVRDPYKLSEACILYQQLGGVLGNSLMRSAVSSYKIIEKFFENGPLPKISSYETFPIIQDVNPVTTSPTSKTGEPARTIVTTEAPSTPQSSPSSAAPTISPNSASAKQINNSYFDTQIDTTINWYLKGKAHIRPSENREFRGIVQYSMIDETIASCIKSMDLCPGDERIIITGGSRSQVKLWNLEKGGVVSYYNYSNGNSIAAQQMQNENIAYHKEIVHKVQFLDTGSAAFSDGPSIVVWDIEAGITTSVLKNADNNQNFVTFSKMKGNDQQFLIGTTNTDNTVKFFDLRTGKEAFEWRIASPTSFISKYQLKCLASSEHFVSVGLSNGSIFLLELHSGLIIDSFRAHEKEITKIVPIGGAKQQFFTCSTDTKSMSPLSLLPGAAPKNPNATSRGALSLWNTHSVPAQLDKYFIVPTKKDYTNSADNSTALSATSMNSASFIIPSSSSTSGSEKSTGLGAASGLSLGTRNADHYVSMDVNCDFEELFAITNHAVCHTTFENLQHSSGQQGDEKRATFSQVIKPKGKNAPFTDVRFLPHHKLLLVSTDDGMIKVFR